MLFQSPFQKELGTGTQTPSQWNRLHIMQIDTEIKYTRKVISQNTGVNMNILPMILDEPDSHLGKDIIKLIPHPIHTNKLEILQ